MSAYECTVIGRAGLKDGGEKVTLGFQPHEDLEAICNLKVGDHLVVVVTKKVPGVGQ